jgi:hypothetical protein
MESFAPWIARIEVQMTECVLDELIRPIPPEWYDDDNDALLRLLEHLHRRRTRVADLILEAKRSNRRPFPKWDETLSNALQLAPQKGTLAQDLDAELDRLYADHVALQRAPGGVGAPGSRAQMRSYCSQVFRQARLWERIEKSIPATEFTFPGDPMRLDYSYRRNGTRGFVHTLSVSRAPREAQNFAYTAERITAKAPWKTEFAAVTDVELTEGNLRHRFVRDTLRDAGVEPVPRDHFAVWVSKLKPLLQY